MNADLDYYEWLQAEIRGFNAEKSALDQKIFKYWQEAEKIKNKYGGMPPKAEEPVKDRIRIPSPSLFNLIAIILLICSFRTIAAIPQDQAVRAIIGETLGRETSFAAKVQIAAVIRRRGSLRGVYGLRNPVVSTAGPRAIRQARRAWIASAHVHALGGFFGCESDAEYFRSIGLNFVRKIGHTVFYK